MAETNLRRIVTLPVLALPIWLCLCMVPDGRPLMAQSAFHFSATVGYEMTEGFVPAYDITVLYNQIWGLRYTEIPDMEFDDGKELRTTDEFLSVFDVEGDYKMPMVIRTIDYRAYQGKKTVPFGFLTAYVGAGYNELKLSLKRRQFRIDIDSEKLLGDVLVEKVKTPVYSMAFGFYGGESFVVLDTRVLYFKGKTEPAETSDYSVDFDHWMILVSIGIGF
ncbi:MAG: hypothetical protein GY866_11665 [Proteobacteria bacterium]|nr:hypothetical protein [Pseudomonadota bacterium]